MMDSTDMLVLLALISPIYLALAGIYMKVGLFDRACIEFDAHIKRDEHD